MNKPNELPKMEAILEQISDLDFGGALVWVYVWDVICDYYNDEGYKIKEKERVWEALCEAVSENIGFTLQHGTESLTEEVREWLIESELMIDLTDEEDKCDVCEHADGEPHCDCGDCDCGETDNQAGETNE